MPRVPKAAKAAKKVQNAKTRQIYSLLKARFPELSDKIEDVVYQYIPHAIRVRVISPEFDEVCDEVRQMKFDKALKALPRDIEREISMAFLMTPEETEDPKSLVYREFENPTGEYL
jgi:hypothetical protein